MLIIEASSAPSSFLEYLKDSSLFLRSQSSLNASPACEFLLNSNLFRLAFTWWSL